MSWAPAFLALAHLMSCSPNATLLDASGSEGLPDDGGTPDGDRFDAEPEADATPSDAGVMTPDGGSYEGCSFSIGTETSSAVPDLLSETGLYSDIAFHRVALGIMEFAPRFLLWSDGAQKTRWVTLPACVDTSDMNSWTFPIGTRFFKEFVVDGRRIETRMIHRFGPAPDDFSFAAYVWNETETEAHRTPTGLQNARGTAHDVPPEGFCNSCHGHRPERVLGFSAIQLSETSTGTFGFARLVGERRVTHAGNPISLPGTAQAQRALGYLHANCGNCHNETSLAIPFRTPFSTWLRVEDLGSLEETALFRTAVDVPVEHFFRPTVTHRIRTGTSTESCVTERMRTRGNTFQMPPIASEMIDPLGVAEISAWIDSL